MALDKSISRRRVLTGAGAAGVAGIAGCLSGGGGNGNSENSADEFTAWSFGPNFPVLEERARVWNEDNDSTVNPEEIGASDQQGNQWSSALQTQTNLPGIGLMLPPNMVAAARNGGLENVNDVVMPNIDKVIDSAISAFTVDGDFFSIPHSVNPVSLIYNTQLFEQAGLPTNPDDVHDELATWDDYITAGEQIQEETGADMLAYGSNNIRPMNGMITQFDGGFYNGDGEFQFDQSNNVEVMQLGKRLADISANLGPFSNTIWDEYREGNVASFVMPGWYIGSIEENLADMEGEWRITKLPEPPNGGARAATAGGAPEVIPVANNDDVKTAAKEFGEFGNLTKTSFEQKLNGFIFPANTVDDSEVLSQEFDYFGGQTILDPLFQTLDESPPQDRAPNNEVQSMYQEAHRLILDEGAPIQETLADTHESMVEVVDEKDMSRATVEEIRNSA